MAQPRDSRVPQLIPLLLIMVVLPPVGDEPQPNGRRINLGFYGGTAEASKSPFDTRSEYGG